MQENEPGEIHHSLRRFDRGDSMDQGRGEEAKEQSRKKPPCRGTGAQREFVHCEVKHTGYGEKDEHNRRKGRPCTPRCESDYRPDCDAETTNADVDGAELPRPVIVNRCVM